MTPPSSMVIVIIGFCAIGFVLSLRELSVLNLRPAEPVRSYGTAHGRKGNPAAGFRMYIRGIAQPLSVIIPHSDQMKKPAVIRRPQALFEIRSFLHTGAAKRKLISKEQGTAALIAHFRALCYHAGRNGNPQAARLFFQEVKSDMRAAGILLPVSSLPSPYGIGSFSESARRVIRQIRKAGQRFWQILPLGPTGYGDSPYQSFSAFAGNPYFIDLDTLLQEGLVTEEEVRTPDFGQDDESRVDYQKLYENRFTLLKQAFERSDIASDDAFRKFCRENAFWLDDYCLFMAIKDEMGGRSWFEWPDEIRLRKAEAIADWESRTKEQADFYRFLQYKFTQQWSALKKYANELGVEVIGDIPIYVAADSSDSWSHPELFQFDEDHRPVAVAGCPPDAFSADGQLWGNPLYNWAAQEESGFAWWKERIRFCLNLYDIVRIDHFRGFDEYYSVPAGAPTAAGGHWEAGPGMKLFRALSENPAVTPRSIIAEDLGYLTPSVIKLVKDSGFPGMKVLEFAFDSRESSDYLPHSYVPNTVVYTGTHDNQTLAAWYWELNEEDRRLADDYAGLSPEMTDRERNLILIRMAMESVSDLCVIPMQDYLCLGAEARMNHPSTLGGNWCWRMKEDAFTDELAAGIRRLTQISAREGS